MNTIWYKSVKPEYFVSFSMDMLKQVFQSSVFSSNNLQSILSTKESIVPYLFFYIFFSQYTFPNSWVETCIVSSSGPHIQSIYLFASRTLGYQSWGQP